MSAATPDPRLGVDVCPLPGCWGVLFRFESGHAHCKRCLSFFYPNIEKLMVAVGGPGFEPEP